MTARIHDEGFRCQHGLDVRQQQGAILAIRDQACGRCLQQERCVFDLRCQRGDPCVACGALGPRECGPRRLCPEVAHRDSRNHHLVGGTQSGREGGGVEVGELSLGCVEAPDQEEAPDFEIACMRGVHSVAVLFECRARRVERLRGPAQVTRGERDLGLGDDTPRAGNGLFRTEGARRTAHENLCPGKITKLRHCDAAKGQRRRVVAQGDPVQGADWITRREGTRRGRD